MNENNGDNHRFNSVGTSTHDKIYSNDDNGGDHNTIQDKGMKKYYEDVRSNNVYEGLRIINDEYRQTPEGKRQARQNTFSYPSSWSPSSPLSPYSLVRFDNDIRGDSDSSGSNNSSSSSSNDDKDISVSTPISIDTSSYHRSFTVDALKSILKQYKLPVYGNKSALISRIIDNNINIE